MSLPVSEDHGIRTADLWVAVKLCHMRRTRRRARDNNSTERVWGCEECFTSRVRVWSVKPERKMNEEHYFKGIKELSKGSSVQSRHSKWAEGQDWRRASQPPQPWFPFYGARTKPSGATLELPTVNATAYTTPSLPQTPLHSYSENPGLKNTNPR